MGHQVVGVCNEVKLLAFAIRHQTVGICDTKSELHSQMRSSGQNHGVLIDSRDEKVTSSTEIGKEMPHHVCELMAEWPNSYRLSSMAG